MYLNQTVTHKRKTGVNEFNSPIFAADAFIPCRFAYRRKLIRSREKQELISEAVMYTETPVKNGDAIVYDGIEWPVLTVADHADLDGKVLFYEVML